jgi:hypothetical protein
VLGGGWWVFGFVDICGFQFIKDFTIKEPSVFGGKNRLVLKNYRFQLFHKVITLPSSMKELVVLWLVI